KTLPLHSILGRVTAYLLVNPFVFSSDNLYFMHTKSELEALSIEQLTEIAKGFQIPLKNDTSILELIYSIFEADIAEGTAAQEKPAP
uniref:hypothetical protein n=1 Tax=Klebsiella pneumoniae TaxID=573 RepID=UPI0025A0EE57